MKEYRKIEYKKLRDMAFGAALIALLIIAIVTAGRLNSAQNAIINLRSELFSVEQQLRYVNSQLEDISAQQEESGRNFTNYQWDYVSKDAESNLATVNVSFILKQYIKDAEVNVHFVSDDDDDDITIASQLRNGKFYVEDVHLDIDKSYTVTYSMESDIVKSEIIGNINVRSYLNRRIDFKAMVTLNKTNTAGTLTVVLFNDYSKNLSFKIASIEAIITYEDGAETLDLSPYLHDHLGAQSIQHKELPIENTRNITEVKFIITDGFGFIYNFYSDFF